MGCDIGPLYDEGQEQEIGELEKVIKLTCNSTFTPHEYAEALYNVGYRKESETAKEILSRLMRSYPIPPIQRVLKIIAEEYGVEVE